MTTAPTPETIARLREQYDRCFACGTGNPIGLHLDGFRIDETGIVAPFRARPEYAGFDDILHGGIVATALDEIMAWAAMLREGVMVFTGTLDLRYRAPASVDADYVLRGRVKERRGKRLRLEGSMEAEGRVVAEGAGLYLAKEPVEATLR